MTDPIQNITNGNDAAGISNRLKRIGWRKGYIQQVVKERQREAKDIMEGGSQSSDRVERNKMEECKTEDTGYATYQNVEKITHNDLSS